MSVKASYLGHSAVLLEGDGKRILIDPFLNGNPSACCKPEDIGKVDLVLLTHDHEDHVGDTEYFLKEGATFVGIYELATKYGEQGYNNEGMNIGGSIEAQGVKIHMSHAFHTCYTGDCVSFIVELEGKQIHHAGDTGLSMEMQLLKEFFDIDLAFLPIGDRFTMGPKSALKAAEWIGAKKVIPIHYNTWPPIAVDVNDFAAKLGEKAVVLKPGESHELS